jgi:hypothetical protein
VDANRRLSRLAWEDSLHFNVIYYKIYTAFCKENPKDPKDNRGIDSAIIPKLELDKVGAAFSSRAMSKELVNDPPPSPSTHT